MFKNVGSNLVSEKYCMTNSIPYTGLGLALALWMCLRPCLVLYGLVNIPVKRRSSCKYCIRRATLLLTLEFTQ